MASEEDENSDEELLDDEWPDDFFDNNSDDENTSREVQARTSNLPSMAATTSKLGLQSSEKTTFADLPLDILRRIVEPLVLMDRMHAMRCSRAMNKAISTSKWPNLGDGTLVVSSHPTEASKHDLHVTIGRVISIIPLDEKSSNAFPRLRRLFGTLHLKELRIESVTMQRPLLGKLNDFIDCCTFDRIKNSNKEFTKTYRVNELIGRARMEVVRETDQRVEKYVRESRRWEKVVKKPNQNNVLLSSSHLPTYLDSSLFLHRVRMGDDLINFTTRLDSVDALEYVIKIVCTSRTNQKLDFVNKNFNVCQLYVDKFELTEHTSPAGTVATNSAPSNRAHIHLDTRNGQPHRARIEVAGLGYPVYKFVGKPRKAEKK